MSKVGKGQMYTRRLGRSMKTPTHRSYHAKEKVILMMVDCD
jgi:hypothetical protein